MFAFQQGTVAALACATSVIGFRMKALVAYDPTFSEECTHAVPKVSFQSNFLNVTWELNQWKNA